MDGNDSEFEFVVYAHGLVHHSGRTTQSTFKLPVCIDMVTSIDEPHLRRSTRSTRSNPSGSEYSGGTSSPSSRGHIERPDEEDQEQQYTTSKFGRKRVLKSYKEDTSDVGLEDEDEDNMSAGRRKTRRSGRNTRLNGFIVSDDEGGEAGRYNTRSREKSLPIAPKQRPPPRERATLRSKRVTRRSARDRHEEEGYEEGADGDADADGSLDDDIDPDAPLTSPSPDPDPDDQDNAGKTYSFRKRAPVNYAIPPPLEDFSKDPLGNGRSHGDRGKGRAKPPRWGASGAELSRMMGLPMPHSDSDSDGPAKTPRKAFGAGGVGGGMFANGSAAGVMAGEFGVGTPSNLGKVGESCKLHLRVWVYIMI
jgi:ATPase family AAA domain-containing protein 2